MSGSQQHHQQSPNFYRSSYSPTDQHHPHYQSSAHPNQTAYRPVANGAVPPPPPPPPTAQQAHYASAAPGRSYYDPVDRTEISSGGWGYPGRERTSSVHSQHVRTTTATPSSLLGSLLILTPWPFRRATEIIELATGLDQIPPHNHRRNYTHRRLVIRHPSRTSIEEAQVSTETCAWAKHRQCTLSSDQPQAPTPRLANPHHQT